MAETGEGGIDVLVASEEAPDQRSNPILVAVVDSVSKGPLSHLIENEGYYAFPFTGDEFQDYMVSDRQIPDLALVNLSDLSVDVLKALHNFDIPFVVHTDSATEYSKIRDAVGAGAIGYLITDSADSLNSLCNNLGKLKYAHDYVAADKGRNFDILTSLLAFSEQFKPIRDSLPDSSGLDIAYLTDQNPWYDVDVLSGLVASERTTALVLGIPKADEQYITPIIALSENRPVYVYFTGEDDDKQRFEDMLFKHHTAEGKHLSVYGRNDFESLQMDMTVAVPIGFRAVKYSAQGDGYLAADKQRPTE